MVFRFSLISLLVVSVVAHEERELTDKNDYHSYSYSLVHHSFGDCDSSSCSTEVLEAFGYQDKFCAINDLSCMDGEGCDIEWITAHCACDTGALFGSYSYNFLGTKEYCCGDSVCQDAVADMYVAQGYSESSVHWYLDSACNAVDCGSFSYSYSIATTEYTVDEKGWCYSPLDYEILNVEDAATCWSVCGDKFGADVIVAVDYYEDQSCYCQNSCECMSDIGDEGTLIVEAGLELPDGCPSYSMSFSFSMSMDCAADCSDEILSTEGDHDAFCALDVDISCLDDCGGEWIAAHCACDTGALFGSFSYDFNEAYCCGNDECQDAVLNMYTAAGNNKTAVDYYLEVACSTVACGSYSVSYSHSYVLSHTNDDDSMTSFSHSFSHGYGGCDFSECSTDVRLAFGNEDAFCNTDYADCMTGDNCFIEYIDAHCACDAGFLFASYSFDFAGSDVFCCGSSACQSAVEAVYMAYGMDETAAKQYLEASCIDVDCPSASSYSYSYSVVEDDTTMSFNFKSPEPSISPSASPSIIPSQEPSALPSSSPTGAPSILPSPAPSALPSSSPSAAPSQNPTPFPSAVPTSTPTPFPSISPTPSPSVIPTPYPSATPTSRPTPQPTVTYSPTTGTPYPSIPPTPEPTGLPSAVPTPLPTFTPTQLPIPAPTPLPTMTPQSGLTIVGPDRHWLSEDGTTTSSFTVALAEEPLSPVTVVFSPQYGSYVISPTSVTLDYANYTSATTFTLTAIDNFVDQGDNYNDSVVIKVRSADSMTLCESQNRPVCGQAALYGDLVVKKLNVSIIDDDTAGVLINSTFVNATYDNFGDSLTPGSYRMTLNSRPRFPVTITMSGYGSYTTVSPSTITISPKNWQTPVAITVSADAATSNRPVCASGNRHCDELNARIETIAHEVSSTDKYFNALTISSTIAAAEVVHDATDSPHVSGGNFNNLLNGIVVSFDLGTDRGGFSGTFDCTNVLDITTSNMDTYFGTGSYCSFSSDSTLKITFGQAATVVPGDNFVLKDLVFKSSATGASLYTMNQTFAVGQPANAIYPQLSLKASSTAVGVCDDLILDGSSSTGSGGRALTYNFSVSPGAAGVLVANISEVLALANAQSGGVGTYYVTIPSADMPRGGSMVFSLKATNFLGNTGVSIVTVKKLGIPAPIISIQGSNPRTTLRSDKLKLEAIAALPTMTCLSFDISSAKMTFVWSELTGGYTGSLTSSKNPRKLTLEPDSLDALNSYTFQVVGFMTDTPYINNTATVNVEVLQQRLVAIITGGAYQQYGIDTGFSLYGDESTDPDASAVAFTYYWACAADTSGASCSGLTISSSSSSTLAVAAGDLTVGEYTFTLSVFKGARNDTTTCIVEIVNGAPPVITITAPTNAKYNTDENYLSIISSVSSSLGYSTEWTPSSSDVTSPFQQGGGLKSSVKNKLTVVVALYLLTEGDTYTFQLTATDTAGESSYSTVSIVMNEPPSSGSVLVTPINGYALETTFTFTAVNWVEDDLPITYIFGTAGLLSDFTADASTLSPFGDERSDATYSNVVLTQGLNITNYTVGCFAQVVDYYGAIGIDTTTIRVAFKQLTVGQLANISAIKASTALDSNDADGSKQILKAALRGLQYTVSGNSGARRQLLGSRTGSAAAVRATALADLWSTYAITTITVSDVASLLSVLVGVVDVPSEVSFDVASGSQFFLHTVLRATLGANIGISTASTGYVGETLTYLFQTPLFNATDYIHMNTQNMTQSLALTSVAQLYGAFDGVGYALTQGDVDMYSYRTAASTMLRSFNLHLSAGGSTDTITSLYFNESTANLASVSSTSISGSDLLDLRFYTLNFNVYAAFLKGTSGTPAAVGSRLDQSSGTGGITLLRSKLTVVEISQQDSQVALDVVGLTNKVYITLKATVPFNTSYHKFERVMSCPTNGAVLDLNCPYTADTHTCDHATHGGVSSINFFFFSMTFY
jgi:hypothetical protein